MLINVMLCVILVFNDHIVYFSLFFQLETLSREDLASRLTLQTAVAVVGKVRILDSAITIMDVCGINFKLAIRFLY